MRTAKHSKLKMKYDIVSYIASQIDMYIKWHIDESIVTIADFYNDMKIYIFNDVDANYIRDEDDDNDALIYTPPTLISIPSKKYIYDEVVNEILQYYATHPTFHNLKKIRESDEQVQNFYGLMKYDECVKEAFEKYLATSTNQTNIDLVRKYVCAH